MSRAGLYDADARVTAGPGGRPPRFRGVAFTLKGVLAGLFVLLVAAVCVSFGFWQLDRLEQRRAQNTALLRAMNEPVLQLDAAAGTDISRDPTPYLYRQVRVRGRFQPSGDVVLRGRSHDGSPGVHLFSSLEIDGGGAAVLVNRGWIPSADAVSVDPRTYRENGLREIEGLVQLYPAARGQGVPVEREVDGFPVFSLARLDQTELEARSTAPLVPFYIQQLPNAAMVEPPVRLASPSIDEGPHLGYAVQWFSFAAIFLIGFVVVVVLRSRADEPDAYLPAAP